MKRCPYCLREHERRARCCSDYCERKLRGKSGYVTRSRREAVAKIMDGIQLKMRHVPKWRKVAMGDDSQLEVIFGAPLPDITPRHGETLDA